MAQILIISSIDGDGVDGLSRFGHRLCSSVIAAHKGSRDTQGENISYDCHHLNYLYRCKGSAFTGDDQENRQKNGERAPTVSGQHALRIYYYSVCGYSINFLAARN